MMIIGLSYPNLDIHTLSLILSTLFKNLYIYIYIYREREREREICREREKETDRQTETQRE